MRLLRNPAKFTRYSGDDFRQRTWNVSATFFQMRSLTREWNFDSFVSENDDEVIVSDFEFDTLATELWIEGRSKCISSETRHAMISIFIIFIKLGDVYVSHLWLKETKYSIKFWDIARTKSCLKAVVSYYLLKIREICKLFKDFISSIFWHFAFWRNYLRYVRRNVESNQTYNRVSKQDAHVDLGRVMSYFQN